MGISKGYKYALQSDYEARSTLERRKGIILEDLREQKKRNEKKRKEKKGKERSESLKGVSLLLGGVCNFELAFWM